MSDQTGDIGGRDRGRRRWTLVSTQGELEGSDDAASSGSSSDFVQLEDEEVVSYHHKEPVASPSGSGLQARDDEVDCDMSEVTAATGVDDLVTVTGTDDTVVPPDGVNNLSAHRRSLTTWDNCWYWDDDCIPKADSVESDDPQLLDIPSSSSEELLTHVAESVISADQGEMEVRKEEDVIEDVSPLSSEGDGGGIHRQTCDSDSNSDHSDFVRLDPDMVEEVNLLNPEAAKGAAGLSMLSARQNVMQSSTSSSGSSVSVNFRFVHPVAGQPGHYSDGAESGNDNDDDSIPLDVDDRCESDISGIADDDDDLSSISYNIADLPLTVGNVVRSYRHRPNTKMNTFLTVVALVTTFAAIGIGIGHYFGSVKEASLRDDQVVHMKSLQDDYLRCLKQQNTLSSQLAASTPSEKKISAVTSLWKSKYEELIFEKADLEMKMITMNEEMKMVEDQIKTCQTETVKLKDDLNQLDTEFFAEGNKLRESITSMTKEQDNLGKQETDLEAKIKTCQEESAALRADVSQRDTELHTCKHIEGNKLRESIAAMTEERDKHRRREEELERQLGELSSMESTSGKMIVSLENQLDAEREAHARTLDKITTLKNRLNQLQTEHIDLQEKSTKLRYVEHPANSNDPPEVSAIVLKNTVNQLANENDDLKTAIGKMRYRPYLNSPAKTDCAGKQADDDSTAVTLAKTTQLLDSASDTTPSQDEGEETGVSSVEVPTAEVEGPADTDPEGVRPDVQQESEQTKRLAALQEWLQHERGCTQLWQFYSKETSHNRETADSEQFNPTFFTCVSYLLRQVDASQLLKDTAAYIVQDTEVELQKKWAFFKMMLTDSAFNNLLRRKWEEFDAVAASSETVDKARGMVETIRGLLQQKWEEFNQYAESSSKTEDKDGKLGADSSEKFQTYLNRTKETVDKLTQKIKSTWSHVKNFSSEFLTKHEPMKKIEQVGKKLQGSLKSLTKTIKTQLQEIKKKIRQGKKMLFQHRPWKHGCRKHKGHKCRKDKHCWDDHHRFASTKHRHFGATKRDRTHGQSSEKRHFRSRPHHKQRQSAEYEESYDDFWRMAPFTPDEIVPEDFFEGNRREQRKQKQRVRKMHGRLQQFNEEMLYSMDDDDIEEMWEDFRKLKDDFDDVKEQPDRLRMWLVCQTRWWKSRFHRKHRDENKIINGCQRQLMPWQMSVLCSHRLWCRDERDGKCHRKFKLGSFCRLHAVSVAERSRRAEDKEKRGKKRAERYSRYEMMHEPLELTTSKAEVSTDDVKLKLLPSAILENDTMLETVDVSDSGASSGGDSIWYLRRMRHHIDADGGEGSVEWFWARAEDRESHRHDSNWYIRSMSGRRDVPPRDNYGRRCNSDPKWLFKRASERQFQRDMPWYLRRAESREEYHFDIVHNKLEDWGGN